MRLWVVFSIVVSTLGQTTATPSESHERVIRRVDWPPIEDSNGEQPLPGPQSYPVYDEESINSNSDPEPAPVTPEQEFPDLSSIIVPVDMDMDFSNARYRQCDASSDGTSCYDAVSGADGCGLINHRLQARIVNGEDTKPNEYPWMVALEVRSGRNSWGFKCGGALITNRHVLTAAHCLSKRTIGDLRVVLGEHIRGHNDTTEEYHYLKYILQHPYYNKQRDLDYDIGILGLTNKVTFTQHIRPICLPPAGKENFDNRMGLAIGWGHTKKYGRISDTLKSVQLPIMSNHDCRTKTSYLEWQIKDRMVCAGYPSGIKDTCSGDSGGPLSAPDSATHRHILVGLTSHGKGCAERNHPGIYAKVSEFLDWITQHTREGCYCNLEIRVEHNQDVRPDQYYKPATSTESPIWPTLAATSRPAWSPHWPTYTTTTRRPITTSKRPTLWFTIRPVYNKGRPKNGGYNTQGK